MGKKITISKVLEEILKSLKRVWRNIEGLINDLHRKSGRKTYSKPKTVARKELLNDLETESQKMPSIPTLPPTIPTETTEIPESQESPEPPQIYPLNLNGVSGEQSWLEHKNNMQNLKKIDDFIDENQNEYEWFGNTIKKIKNDIQKMGDPETFDQYTTEKAADYTVKIARRFTGAIDSCNRVLKNPNKDPNKAKELKSLIEEYLSNIGVESMHFKAGDNYEKWAELGMSENVMMEYTEDKSKHETLCEIYVQPHYFKYIDEYGQLKQRIFGGNCSVYVFEE